MPDDKALPLADASPQRAGVGIRIDRLLPGADRPHSRNAPHASFTDGGILPGFASVRTRGRSGHARCTQKRRNRPDIEQIGAVSSLYVRTSGVS